VLVGNDRPVTATVFGHCDDERIRAVDALVRLRGVVMSAHKRADDCLYGYCFLDKQTFRALAPLVAIVTRLDLVKHRLWRNQTALVD